MSFLELRRNYTVLFLSSVVHQHQLCVLGIWRATNPNQPVVQLRFLRRSLRGFPEANNAGSYEYLGLCMRDNGTIRSFVCSQCLL